jgi:hypothetical protein
VGGSTFFGLLGVGGLIGLCVLGGPTRHGWALFIKIM